jgi:hypothetical protein
MARLLLITFFMLSLAPGRLLLAAEPVIRDKLVYQVSLGPWSDAARVQLVLKELEPGRYLAEGSVAAKGVWKVSSRWLPVRYQAEMVHREGRLWPLFYREEFVSKGQRVLKEHRFDHETGRLSLWRQVEGCEKVKEWEMPLTSQLYDPLTLFYNVRLGAFGPLPAGSTLRLMVLATPKPQEMVFTVAPGADMERKVTIERRRAESNKVSQYFCSLSPEQVPTLVWTQVPVFGKFTGRLLNPGDIRKDGLLAPTPVSAPGIVPQR